MGRIIGIDLGTTNQLFRLWNRQPKIIANSEGQRTTPSVVAYTKDGEVLVGAAARAGHQSQQHRIFGKTFYWL